MAVDDSYTKALLHINGVDGSITFTDESGKTWTANGNAQIDTAQSKFGVASGLFDGTGDYISTPDHDDFNVGSGDFTVDFWFKRNTTGTTQNICGQYDGASNDTINAQLQLRNTNDLLAAMRTTGAVTKTIVTTSTITDSNWHHVALVRNGNNLKLFLDGTQEGGDLDITGLTFVDSSSVFSIGRRGAEDANYFNGWVDEFRFSKGIARWTANFTPPTKEYAPSNKQPQMML